MLSVAKHLTEKPEKQRRDRRNVNEVIMARWMIIAVGATLLALTLPAASAAAHPLGNFTVNQYSRLEAGRDTVRVRYIVDMAEIPAFQERAALDADQDDAVSDAEARTYLDRQTPLLAAGLRLTVDGAPVELRAVSQDIAFPPGQGGLSTLRLTLDLEARLPASGEPRELLYSVTNYDERLGWREIVVRAGASTTLGGSTATSEERSAELTRYPDDMLSSPLDEREARFTLAPGVAAAPVATASEPVAAGISGDALAGLLSARELTPATMAAALLLAVLLGAGHALTPGHGKTVVAAYLVGARGTALHAVVLGLVTTITHTAGVFLLGFATLLLSRYVLPERIYPWLELISGALVVVLGAGLLRGRLLHARSTGRGAQDSDHHHDHGHDHGHEHDHAHERDHNHDHHHGPGGHTHDHEQIIADRVAQAIQNRAVSWRSLLALGISGGLLPCPSALVVLLGAVALGRVGFGMLLIVAFSLGLAAVLTGIGLVLVYARSLFERLPSSGLLLRALPVASAAIVVLAGLGITAAAIVQL
jgi:ABC-type nickel/cobalt efflux system permease component RcnA